MTMHYRKIKQKLEGKNYNYHWRKCIITKTQELASYLATGDLNSKRLKISARDFAFKGFLVETWQSLERCLSRYWSVSQYCWGMLGDLMNLFKAWAYSSEFCTSGEKNTLVNLKSSAVVLNSHEKPSILQEEINPFNINWNTFPSLKQWKIKQAWMRKINYIKVRLKLKYN